MPKRFKLLIPGSQAGVTCPVPVIGAVLIPRSLRATSGSQEGRSDRQPHRSGEILCASGPQSACGSLPAQKMLL
jgi:hypothetical protein